MYYNGHKFCIKKLEETKRTCDSRITTGFEVTNISSRNDMHPQQSKNRNYGILDDILEWKFNSFKLVLFVVKRYNLWLNQNDLDRNVIEHDSGFTMINTRLFKPLGDDSYVLPSQCEQVFYFGVPHKLGWSFVVRHDPRGRSVKYNVIEEAQEEVNDYQEWQLPSDEEEEDNDDFGHANDNGDNDDDDVDDDHDHGDDHGDDGHDDDDGDEDGGANDDDQSKKYDDGDDDDDDDMDEDHDDQWNV